MAYLRIVHEINEFWYLLFFADSTFHNKRTLLEDALEAIRDLEQVKESLEDVSNDENEHFEADETNFDGKRKHDDDGVNDTAKGENEDLAANDPPNRGQQISWCPDRKNPYPYCGPKIEGFGHFED